MKLVSERPQSARYALLGRRRRRDNRISDTPVPLSRPPAAGLTLSIDGNISIISILFGSLLLDRADLLHQYLNGSQILFFTVALLAL